MTLVQDVINHAISQPGVFEVVLAYPRGSKNYGQLYRDGVSDVGYTVLYLPTENDLYVRAPMTDRYITAPNFEYKLVDVRTVPKIMKTANLTALDFIWAEPDEKETSVLASFEDLDFKMFVMLKAAINANIRSFYLSHIAQLEKALHTLREKGYSYNTGKRLVTAAYLLWSLDVFRTNSEDMNSSDFMALMLSTGQWKDYPSEFGSMGNLATLKFDLGEQGMAEFSEKVEVFLEYCLDVVTKLPLTDLESLQKVVNSVEEVLVADLKKFYSNTTYDPSEEPHYKTPGKDNPMDQDLNVMVRVISPDVISRYHGIEEGDEVMTNKIYIKEVDTIGYEVVGLIAPNKLVLYAEEVEEI